MSSRRDLKLCFVCVVAHHVPPHAAYFLTLWLYVDPPFPSIPLPDMPDNNITATALSTSAFFAGSAYPNNISKVAVVWHTPKPARDSANIMAQYCTFPYIAQVAPRMISVPTSGSSCHFVCVVLRA